MKPTIIILPGWMHTSSNWQLVMSELGKQSDTQVLDIPGFGHIPALHKDQTFQDVVGYVEQQIRSLSTENIVLVGHSFGGRIAVELTQTDLQINQLILIGSPNIYRPSLRIRLKMLLLKIFSPIKNLIPENVRSKFRDDDYAVAKGGSLELLIKETIGYDQTDLLKNTHLPTHLIWGEEDKMAPLKLAKEMNTLLPNSTLETFPSIGHDLHLEKPTLLAAKILKYVNV